MKTIYKCPHCNERIIESELIRCVKPDSCVCYENEWMNPSHIPNVCGMYSGDGDENCRVCEHDKACHA